MKFIACTVLCLLSASSAFAAPKVTEISLKDYPGFGPNGHLQTELVFHDDSVDVTRGIGADVKSRRYTLKPGEFQKLADSLEEQHFFDLKPYYPEGPMIADAANFVVSATREGEKKEVTYVYNTLPNSQPLNLWMVEKILRGVAAESRSPEPAPATN